MKVTAVEGCVRGANVKWKYPHALNVLKKNKILKSERKRKCRKLTLNNESIAY